ncbi:MAG: dephospho-CoA kinase [Cellulosilyticaceae bacterium]
MKRLGIVGGIGAGKTTVVTILQELVPCYVIGADEIGHTLLLKHGGAYEAVIEVFGEGILDEERNIVRSRLAAIVFSDRAQLDRLNQITHPLIHQEVERQIADMKATGQYNYIIIDAALLIEIGLVRLTDVVLGVFATEKVRVERVMARDQVTEEAAMARIKKQKTWEELEKVVDYVINNDESYDSTMQQLKGILEKM